MPLLPVLSEANRFTEAGWHNYVTHVYGSALPTGQQLDLNNLNFFYSKQGKHATDQIATLLNETHVRVSSCVKVCKAGKAMRTFAGTPWVGSDPATPAGAFKKLGFFVRRPFLSPQSMRKSCMRLEVSHARTAFHGGEQGVAWYFHTIGSGIYLDCQQLPTRGRVAVHRNRKTFEAHEGFKWIDDRHFPRIWMRAHGVAMVIFTREDFWHWGHSGENPRAEIIVLLPNASSTARPRSTGACPRGVRTLAGWNGSHECECKPDREFLTCASGVRKQLRRTRTRR